MPLADDADLTLFYAPKSRAQMALCFMEELGRPYRIERIDLTKGEQKSAALTKHNPMGKVPVVVDGDVAISETGAIIAYLVDTYAAGRLGPGPQEPHRAAYLRWLFFGGNVIEPSLGERFFKWEVPSSSAAWGCYADMIATVTKAITERRWLAGDAFTGADLYVASLLGYGLMFGAIEGGGPIADYVARAQDRDAYRNAQAIGDRMAADVEAAGRRD